MALAMKKVFSSSVDSIGYDPDTQQLHVKFQNGKVAVYSDVPPDVASQVVDAASVGTALNNHIKGKFAFGYINHHG